MGTTFSLSRHPSHEHLERLALLGAWHLDSGQKEKARLCFETVLKWMPESQEAKDMIQFLGPDMDQRAHI